MPAGFVGAPLVGALLGQHLKRKRFNVNIRWFTRFVSVLAIVTLIVGFSACDQIQQLFIPAPPQMEGVSGEISIGLVYPTTG